MNKPERIAAFFDLDGTLIAEPSMEWRFFATLRWRRAIPTRNYFLWLARTVWLAPRGVQAVRHMNKMYLRGLRTEDGGAPIVESPGQSWAQAWGQGSKRAVMSVPRFFPAGVDQVGWHARQGHAIVLVSGTLAPLAQELGLALTVRLALRGIAACVGVCATQLEEKNGRWTGRIVGDAVFGEGKARAMRRLAEEEGFDLARCYAYGDSTSDLAMLEAVGRPCVVNPSERMQRRAQRREWAVLAWAAQGRVAPSAPAVQETDPLGAR